MGFFRQLSVFVIMLIGMAIHAQMPPDAETALAVRTRGSFTPQRQWLLTVEAKGTGVAPEWGSAFPGALTEEQRDSADGGEWRRLFLDSTYGDRQSVGVLLLPRLGDTALVDYLDEEIAVDLAPEYPVVALPEYREINNRFFHFTRRLHLEGNRLTEHTEFQRKAGWDNPALPGHREALAELAAEQRQEIVVAYQRPLPAPGASWILSRRQELKVLDASNWELTTVIRRQPAGADEILWQGVGAGAETPPELVDLTLTGADGKTRPVNGMWEAIPRMNSNSPIPERQRLIHTEFALTVPEAQAGDQVDFTVRQHFDDRDRISFCWVPGDPDTAIAQDSFELSYPGHIPIEFHTDVLVPVSRRTDKHTEIIRWELANPVYSHFRLPVGTSDQTYARGLQAQVEHCAEEQPESAALARRIAAEAIGAESAFGADSATQRELVRRLRDAVAERIELLEGVEELFFCDLIPADETLRAGSATPGNRTLLLYSMLKALDVHAELLPLADDFEVNFLDRDQKYFIPGWCDLLIRVIPVDDSGEYYVGDGDNCMPLGSTAWANCAAMSLGQHSLGSFTTPEVTSQLENRCEWDLRLELDSVGDAQLHWRKRYFGAEYARRKHWLEEADETARFDDFQAQVAKLAPDAGVVQPISYAFDGYPGEESFAVELTNWAQSCGQGFYVALPGWENITVPPERYLASNRAFNWNGTLRYIVQLPRDGKWKLTGYPESEEWGMPGTSHHGGIYYDSIHSPTDRWEGRLEVVLDPVLRNRADQSAWRAGRQLLERLRRPFVFIEKE